MLAMTKATAPTEDDVTQRRRAFGDVLAQAITAARITQDELAVRLGVKQPTISGWVSAANEPRYEDVFATERALGVKPGALSRCPATSGTCRSTR